MAERSDAVLLTSVDGRVHLEQFRRIASYGKPVFIDKPLATTMAEAKEIMRLAAVYKLPVMSSSSLRYAAGLIDALNGNSDDVIIGADCYGPAGFQPTHPGLFWYGIHTVEMLYSILGKGCVQVTAATNESHEFIVGQWSNGRIGTIRGNRLGNSTTGATIHRTKESEFVDCSKYPKPVYASLLEMVMGMFLSGTSPIDPKETVEIIRFLEAANESRATGRTVSL